MDNELIIAIHEPRGGLNDFNIVTVCNLMNLARKDERSKVEIYLQVLNEYVSLLGDELNDTVGMASIHGWQSTRVKQGKDLRKKIETLKCIYEEKEQP